MDHDQVRDELARQLVDDGDIPEELVDTEKAIHNPIYSGWRRPDVMLADGPPNFEGIAFEIKMSISKYERSNTIGQLQTYRLGGWHPVIVAEEDIFNGGSDGKITLSDIAFVLNASYVALQDSDSPEFELVYDLTPQSTGLPYPVGEPNFKRWKKFNEERS